MSTAATALEKAQTKALLAIVFAWGAERGYVASNPAEKVKNVRRQKGAPEANRPCADEEREAVLDAVPSHMRSAIGLMMFTGLGPKDALRWPRTFFKAGAIATRRSKTGEPVFWPAPSALRDILEAGPTHNALTLCANSNGLPWTEDGFRPHGAKCGSHSNSRDASNPLLRFIAHGCSDPA